MQPIEALAIAAAGIAAGGINAMVGSGTLITFPTLLAFGFPPVVANVSNNVGLVLGNITSVYGYRRELGGQLPRLIRFGTGSLLGSLAGAFLLLKLPGSAFDAVVPGLILLACVLVLLQPRINRRLAARQGHGDSDGGVPMWLGVFGSGIYGGYFGAAQGVLLMGLFGSFLRDDLQRLNAAKNVLATIVNGVAALVFVVFADVNWAVAALVAGGSSIGGLLGARLGRRLPPNALRALIITVGVTAATVLLLR